MNELIEEKKYDNLVKAAVLFIIVFQYGHSFVTPALGAISLDMPDVDPVLIKQIQSLPSLIAIPAAFLCGIFERFMKKRTMVTMAMIFTFIGGILPAFYGDIYFILATRVIFGIGRGMIFTLATSMIADLFVGQERANLMGYKATVGGLSGSLFQLIGGAVAILSWRYSFLCTLILLPFLLFVFWKLPEPDVKPLPVKEAGISKQLGIKTWLLTVGMMIGQIFIFSFMTNVAIVMAQAKIGNPGQAGIVLTTFTLATGCAGLFYGRGTSRIFGKFTVPLCLALFGIAFLILTNTNTVAMYLAAAIIFGLGFGTFNPDMYTIVVRSVPRAAATLAVSIFVGFTNFGQFLSPMGLKLITDILGLTGPKAAWIVAGPLLIAAAVLIAIGVAVSRSKKATAV